MQSAVEKIEDGAKANAAMARFNESCAVIALALGGYAGLRIVFDGPPGPTAGRFVEVEDASGNSIDAGVWHERPDGLWELRLGEKAVQTPTAEPASDEARDYRVCCHHVMNPTNRITYPRSPNPLMTRVEAEAAAKAEQAKGYMVAWVVGRDGLGA